MTVTRDVILDLLPMYFAGEVSADTKTLVDEFLKSDPEFARMSTRFDTLLKERRMPHEEEAAERRTFERTRALMSYRNQTIGVAGTFTVLPFSFWFDGDGIRWMLWRDRPSIAIAFAATAAICWVAAWAIGRHARASAFLPSN